MSSHWEKSEKGFLSQSSLPIGGRGIKESEKEIKIRIIIRTLKGKRGHKRGFVAEDWLERAPSNSPPFDLSGGHPCMNTNEITN